MSRHRSRELAVQYCFQVDFSPSKAFDKAPLNHFWINQAQASDDAKAFFILLVEGVMEKLPLLDSVIEKNLKNWRMNRLEKVDLAVLRVAVFELLYSQDPEKPDAPVVINEALNIAKKYGNKDSASFINGILDAIHKSR
jgi:N utilization substance protein B